MTNEELAKIAREVRKGILVGTHAARSGHPGGSLSAAEIFTYLYFEEMNVDPRNPRDPGRDRFVLSKGHCAPACTRRSRRGASSPCRTSRPCAI